MSWGISLLLGTTEKSYIASITLAFGASSDSIRWRTCLVHIKKNSSKTLAARSFSSWSKSGYKLSPSICTNYARVVMNIVISNEWNCNEWNSTVSMDEPTFYSKVKFFFAKCSHCPRAKGNTMHILRHHNHSMDHKLRAWCTGKQYL